MQLDIQDLSWKPEWQCRWPDCAAEHVTTVNKAKLCTDHAMEAMRAAEKECAEDDRDQT